MIRANPTRFWFKGLLAAGIILCFALEAMAATASGITAGDTTVINGITMVSIPAGSFQMGTQPISWEDFVGHKVTFTYDFQIGKYEITQAQYNSIMDAHPDEKATPTFVGDNNPMESISWYSAIVFCNRLSEAAGLEPCYNISWGSSECDFTKNGFRLPTESEWEYAARAGTTTK
jgi:sulfatase modifying factor 1